MTITEFFKANKTGYALRKPVVCKDGLRLSIQASTSHYCKPAENNAEHYTHVEVSSPNPIRSLRQYGKSGVYAYVPIEKVESLVKHHGGIVKVGGKEV